ncbi:MAG: hypothetical protein IPG45_32995 [Deltaproteobacteria bacterium]|nr:hypothetical protein [Deltaproteobacteria bacterium]
MKPTQWRRAGYFVVLVWAAGVFACGPRTPDDDRPSGSNPPAPRLSGTAGLLQRFLEEEVIAHTDGYVEAGQRLAIAVMTGSADGVTLTQVGNGQSGLISADLDQDGTRETMLNVNLTNMNPEAGPTGPHQFSIGQGGPGMPNLSVGGIMQLNTDRHLKVTGAYGSFESDEVSGYLKEGKAEIGPSRIGGASVAQAGFDVFDRAYAEPLNGDCALEVAASGGTYRIKISVRDNPETAANEAQEFFIP